MSELNIKQLQDSVVDVDLLEVNFNSRYKAYLLANAEGSELVTDWLDTVKGFKDSLDNLRIEIIQSRSVSQSLIEEASLTQLKIETGSDTSKNLDNLLCQSSLIVSYAKGIESLTVSANTHLSSIHSKYEHLKMFSNQILKDFNNGDAK